MTEKPFGTFPLNKREQFSRRWATHLGGDAISRLVRSTLWRLSNGKDKRPRDVEIFQSEKARLHPYDNICEKRVFLTPQLWESQERAALQSYIHHHDKDHFYFIDAGANVGLYSLFVHSCIKKNKNELHLIAIEPGAIARARLKTNFQLSNFNEGQTTILPLIITNQKGNAYLSQNIKSLGESVVSTQKTNENQENIETETLLNIVRSKEFDRIDALKIDIEGHEFPVLKHFYENAPQTLWPSLVIMEIAHGNNETDLKNIFLSRHYKLINQHRGNVVFMREKT